jgi:hypothetical protein
MANVDCFALASSQLNPFLFAEVGTEENGSGLTVLSLLARQGKDAWAEAASWIKLPRADVIASLARSIAAAPLAPPDLAAATATAARLVLLLPDRAPAASPASGPLGAAKLLGARPKFLPVPFIYIALALALASNLLFAHKPPPAGPVPVSQLAQPAAPTTPPAPTP